MPRPKGLRKDLSKGWRRLYEYWKWDLDRKVTLSHTLITQALKKHNSPVVCWSGGKDSSVVLHLMRQHQPDIPVISIYSGVDFPENALFVERLADEWNLNLRIGKPARGESFWEIGKKYGWPIFGKSVASNVERARRTGNIRPQLSHLERVLVKQRLHISCRCSDFIQEKPSKEIETLLGADLKIIGLRASESRARVRLWVDHGDFYYVKRYFGRNRGIWKLNPIAIWTEEDIWAYHKLNRIPYCSLYDSGYPRNGCWTCAMGIRNGQLKRLREGHPSLFRRLITKTEMGITLFKAKLALNKHRTKTIQPTTDLKAVLRKYPDFFDKI